MTRSGRRPHRAKRSLGQNFLVDPNLQRKIVASLDATREDEVLEIGPGRGALSEYLVGACRRLILVELDDELSADLEAAWGARPDVRVVHADFLTVDLSELSRDVYRLLVVGNIPYNVTAPIVFKLLERPRPARIVLMVQREVAQRLAAKPGTSAYGALTVGVQSVATVDALFKVPRTAFRPVPRVDSTVVRIRPFSPPPLTENEEKALRELTRVAFGWRRKQLQKTLREHPRYRLSQEDVRNLEADFGHSLTRRPETFTPVELQRLSLLLAERSSPADSA